MHIKYLFINLLALTVLVKGLPHAEHDDFDLEARDAESNLVGRDHPCSNDKGMKNGKCVKCDKDEVIKNHHCVKCDETKSSGTADASDAPVTKSRRLGNASAVAGKSGMEVASDPSAGAGTTANTSMLVRV
ncbi:hypothetical protein B0T10DRAFT_565408 [Thelonectria olida]|uniref:Secreted protein n=1 Tax=Thelonectria olida TaxID=1576542 RepID=A0A9P9AKD4_9HYPO|nr:hypothetical protein B0T10DRAFT_565408 [Thelonectria olida]